MTIYPTLEKESLERQHAVINRINKTLSARHSTFVDNRTEGKGTATTDGLTTLNQSTVTEEAHDWIRHNKQKAG
jgi:hypothetical protein